MSMSISSNICFAVSVTRTAEKTNTQEDVIYKAYNSILPCQLLNIDRSLKKRQYYSIEFKSKQLSKIRYFSLYFWHSFVDSLLLS